MRPILSSDRFQVPLSLDEVQAGARYYLYLSRDEVDFNSLFGSVIPLDGLNPVFRTDEATFYMLGEVNLLTRKPYDESDLLDHHRFESMVALPMLGDEDKYKFIYLDSADYNRTWFIRNVA